ncbi:hypothetical protein GQ600_17796 [Phytophthora cactorum]|nr:hypothetical protein GQ600_17796 [Phytophthora cactorum]
MYYHPDIAHAVPLLHIYGGGLFVNATHGTNSSRYKILWSQPQRAGTTSKGEPKCTRSCFTNGPASCHTSLGDYTIQEVQFFLAGTAVLHD